MKTTSKKKKNEKKNLNKNGTIFSFFSYKNFLYDSDVSLPLFQHDPIK